MDSSGTSGTGSAVSVKVIRRAGSCGAADSLETILTDPSPPPRDNDEKRRLFPPLSDLLLKSAAACCYILYVPPLLRPTEQQAGHLLLTVLFRRGGSERSARDLGTYPPLFTAARERANDVWIGRRPRLKLSGESVLFPMKSRAPSSSLCRSAPPLFLEIGVRAQGVDLSRAPSPQCSRLKTRTEICTLYIPSSGALRLRRRLPSLPSLLID